MALAPSTNHAAKLTFTLDPASNLVFGSGSINGTAAVDQQENVSDRTTAGGTPTATVDDLARPRTIQITSGSFVPPTPVRGGHIPEERPA